MPKIDIRSANETMLDGMSNFIEPTQWGEMLVARCSPDLKDDSKMLSGEFITKYKNNLSFASFTFYLSMAFDVKKLDTAFIHRFWKHVAIMAGEADTLIQDTNLADKPSTFGKWVKENVDLKNVSQILTGETAPYTMTELDKHPFRYHAGAWMATLMTTKDVTVDFIEKYIHMIPFNALFANQNLDNKFKEDLVKKFALPCTVEKVKYLFLPDGCIVEEDDFDSSNPGRAYYSNSERFAIHDDQTKPVIEKLKEKFPRAFEDCAYPDNAAVMVDK